MMGAEVGATLALGVIAALLLYMGMRRGFFSFPEKEWVNPIRFSHLIGAFAIYFLTNFIVTQLLFAFFRGKIGVHYLAFSSWLNFAMSLLIFALLALFLLRLPKEVRTNILRRSAEGERYSPLEDVSAALYAWLLAFPLVLCLSQGLELIVSKVFHTVQLPEQLAVQFLKSTFADPVYFILAVLAIVILAPLIEETLFRGFLQSFIRQHLGSKQAIVITSVCFSLFHYSAGQALSNIPILFSLFFLSLFLGFLYEKQGSLLAPMTLHASFNAISVINLYLFGGFTTGV